MTQATQTTLTADQMLALIAKLQAEKAALVAAANAPKKLTMKVSDKGAMSIYGLGRFPVTLYATQWERLLASSDDIKAFLATNASLLATKPTA